MYTSNWLVTAFHTNLKITVNTKIIFMGMKSPTIQRFYLPSTFVIDISFEDITSWPCIYRSISTELNEFISGCIGTGRLAFSLSNISITDDIVGLCAADSWTHNIATCMHCNASFLEQDSAIEGSISSTALSSFHKFHAWKMFQNIASQCYHLNY